MPLTIITDNQVKFLLNTLTKNEVHNFQDSIGCALHEYATGSSSHSTCEDQPGRSIITLRNGTSTMFMPSATPHCLGVKGTFIFFPKNAEIFIIHPQPFFCQKKEDKIKGINSHKFQVITLNDSSSYAGSSAAAKSVPTNSSEQKVPSQGSLTLMTAEGKPFAFINSPEITAFRTALTSTLLVSRRTKVKVLTCFGCGRQAYWHVRLTLLLRGSSVKKVHFINRDFSDRAANLMKEFIGFDSDIKRREGWAETSFDLTSLRFGDVEKVLKSHVRAADIIFCTTPSTVPLFDPAILTQSEGRKRARLIIAVGSYKPNMIEIPPEVIDQAVRPQATSHVFQRRAEEGGVIIVDSLAALRDAGELVETNLRADRTLELGELVNLEYMEHQNHLDQAISTEDYDEDPPLPSPSTGSENPTASNCTGISRGLFRRDSLDSSNSTSVLSRFPSRKASINFSSSKPPSAGKPSSFGNFGRPRRSSEDNPFSGFSSNNVTSSSSNNNGNSSCSSSNVGQTLAGVRGRRLSISENSQPRHRNASAMSQRSTRNIGIQQQNELENKLSRWMSGGNVIYKSVGIGLTDLISGIDIVRIAREKGIGTTISDF